MGKWTDGDIKFLKENYIDMVHADMGKVLNRTSRAVTNKCYRLGLRKEEPVWSKYEIDLLKHEYTKVGEKGYLNLGKIANTVGRTKFAICIKAKQLGLTSSKRTLSDEHRKIVSTNIKEYIKDNGHNRGMLGKSHSLGFKEAMSTRVKAMWKDPDSKYHSTENKLRRKNNMIRIRNKLTPNQIYSYAKSGYREDINLYVRSGWEANYTRYLNYLKFNGGITRFEYEPDRFAFSGNNTIYLVIHLISKFIKMIVSNITKSKGITMIEANTGWSFFIVNIQV